jgi:hypothetical protein
MSQLGVENISQPGDAVKEGQALDLKVLEVDPIHHRIVLAVVGYPDVPLIELPKREPIMDDAPGDRPAEASGDVSPGVPPDVEAELPPEAAAEVPPDAPAEGAADTHGE